jgi:hypothetical protein
MTIRLKSKMRLIYTGLNLGGGGTPVSLRKKIILRYQVIYMVTVCDTKKGEHFFPPEHRSFSGLKLEASYKEAGGLLRNLLP